MRKMRKMLFLILVFSINHLSYAGDETGNCPVRDIVVNKSNEFLTGCNAAIIALKADVDGEKEYKKNLNLKLVKNLATQTTQVLEDLGASSNYYESQKQVFLIDSESQVASSCKFDFISKIEAKGCDGKSTPEDRQNEKERIKMLADAIGGDYKAHSLMDSVLHVYGTNKYGYGFENPNPNQCPVNGSAFPLTSQITENSILEIIEQVKIGNQERIQVMLNSFPQLSMIKDANLQEKFEAYIRAFDPAKTTAQDYFSRFFFNKENKEQLGLGVARRCDQMKANISRFICHPIEQMASHDSKISKKLFNKYDPEKDFQDQKTSTKNNPMAYKSYAHLCQTTKEPSKGFIPESASQAMKQGNAIDCVNFKNKVNSVDSSYNCFNQGVRPEESKVAADDKIADFCSRYRCESKDVQTKESCKKGGPLSAEDLKSINSNDEVILQQYTFLKALEDRRKKRDQFLQNSTLADNKSEGKKRFALSAFDLNAFGADAVMKFENIPVTKETTKLVAQEMKEQDIRPSTPEEIRKVVSGEAISQMPAKVAPPAPQNISATSPQAPSNNQYVPAPVFSIPSGQKHDSPSVSTSTPKTTSSKGTAAENEKIDQVQQMVRDLEEIMKPPRGAIVAAAISPRETRPVNEYSPSLEAWARKLAADEASLRARENYANMKDADLWRRERELADISANSERKNADRSPSSGSSHSPNVTKDGGSKLSLKSKQDLAVEVNATSSGLIVTPDKLNKLEKVDLKNLGVNINEPFIISVKLNGKLIHVRVAKVTANGKTFLAPKLNEDNKEIKEVILKSPVFKEFRNYYEHILVTRSY